MDSGEGKENVADPLQPEVCSLQALVRGPSCETSTKLCAGKQVCKVIAECHCLSDAQLTVQTRLKLGCL